MNTYESNRRDFILARKELIFDLGAAADADSAFRGLCRTVNILGFEFYAYTLRVAVPITRFNFIEWNNYPGIWQDRYAAQNYRVIDPILLFGQRCAKPLIWPGPSDPNEKFWVDARQSGLQHGWSQTMRDHRGIYGTFSLARSTSPIVEEELAALEPEMIWLGQFAHATISNLMANKVLPDAVSRLKDVERLTLHWTAEGKTVAEVAAILEMTERNISFHIQNAIVKLNAANKTHAVVKAALLGLIPASDGKQPLAAGA